MQKISIILAVAVLATIGFSSCGNESLKGTSWKSNVTENENGQYYNILNFKTNTECNIISYKNGEESYMPSKGTYTYNAPSIRIDLNFVYFIGTVEGNKMTLASIDGKVTIVFYQTIK